MMDRRAFMAKSGTAGVVSLGTLVAARRAESATARDYYELRRYNLESEEQKKAFGAYMSEAAIPAMNRIGIDPVGVFQPPEDLSPIYVLLRHPSADSFATMTQQLLADEKFISQGAEFLDAPSTDPAYKRVESSLLVAFAGMPRLESPIRAEGRVFQLRVYESPSVKTGQKKIEMFNTAEIDIFRKTGLNPVFFGEALAGEKIPNLTYMLVFNSLEEQKANWKRFVTHPEWKKLSSLPEYANEKILCGITNLSLKPTEYSQI